jgi:uncharacterized protein YjbI with pentapeptide repeats
MTGIKRFLQSGVFAAGSGLLAWWTWDQQWAGSIPALAFLAAFYSVLWLGYSLIMRFATSVPENVINGVKKSLVLFLPLFAGLFIFQRFYIVGAALIFVGTFLIIWKLPDYINRYFINSTYCSHDKAACRKWIFFFMCGLLVFTAAPAVYYQHHYDRAVSRFTSDSEAVRLDALYCLGQFARDRNAYYDRVVQVLSARVRELTEREPESGPGREMALHILQLLGKLQKEQNRIKQPIDLRHSDLKEFSIEELDLRSAILVGVNLSDSCLYHSNLSGANAKHAVMNKIRMRYVDANGADFFLVEAEDADCRYSDFRKARFTYGQWKGSRFDGSRLQDATIRGRSLKETRMYKARMERVNARWAHLQGTDFRRARLDEGDFYKARFNGADLRGASLKKANLKEAVFVNADLRNADLTGAVLEGADFSGADLTGARGIDAAGVGSK